MKDLISNIEYLLQQHDYVFVAGLGGFVLQRESVKISENGSIQPPTVSLGFNSDLNFNDGLLAESLMKNEGLSYEDALTRIDDVVKEFKSALNKKQRLELGNLGFLRKENGTFIFSPQKDISSFHPEFWGNSNINIKYLDFTLQNEIENVPTKVTLSRVKYIWRGVAASVFGLLLYSSFSTSSLQDIKQQSGFYYNINNKTELVAQKISDEGIINSNIFLTEYIDQKKNSLLKADNKPADIQKVIEEKESVKYEKRYFVIVGGDENKKQAQRLLENIKKKGFNASIIETPERYRIYIDSFSDKTKANFFLNNFKRRNKGFGDAWLYSKKVQIES